MIDNYEKSYLIGSAITMILFIIIGMIVYNPLKSLSLGIGYLFGLNVYLYFQLNKQEEK